MHFTAIFSIACLIFRPILADRGNAPAVSPTVCNSEPDRTPVESLAPKPTCYHAADPSGTMGYCPNLSNYGWCNCYPDGIYPAWDSGSPCDYDHLPSSTLALTSTNCASETPSATFHFVPPSITQVRGQRKNSRSFVRGEARYNGKQFNKRKGTKTFSNCDDPAGPIWSKAGFKSKAKVLEQAYDDAVSLAASSQYVDGTNPGFTHYFGGLRTDIQLMHFRAMMAATASADNSYAIQFECKKTPSCSPTSVMVTDATVGGRSDVKVIEVCDAFWTSASTKYLLPNQDHTQPTPPYRPIDNSNAGWCRKLTANGDANVSARRHQYFATAGHSVLHELMHLDSLAKIAGLSADHDGRHGTLDVQRNCELEGAREFLDDYKKENTGGTSPDYNAESYAAAATEIYFMNACGFSQIRPVT